MAGRPSLNLLFDFGVVDVDSLVSQNLLSQQAIIQRRGELGNQTIPSPLLLVVEPDETMERSHHRRGCDETEPEERMVDGVGHVCSEDVNRPLVVSYTVSSEDSTGLDLPLVLE